MTGAEEGPGTLRIVHGDPTLEEIAAVVAVLAGTGDAHPEGEPEATPSQWAPPARLLRRSVTPTGWWESALPQ